MLVAVLILFVLLVFNGIFAMSELAVMTSRPSRLQQAAAKGRGGAAAALALQREPTRFLSTVQVGITLIGIFAGAFGEKAISNEVQVVIARVPELEPYSDTIALVIVVLLITYCSLVLGELIPKRLALAFPESISMLISRPLGILSIIAAVPVRLLTFSTDFAMRLLRVPHRRDDDVSEDDVRALMSRAAGTGVFTSQEHALIQRTMRVADLTVRDLMVPRQDIVWIGDDDPIDAVRVLVGTSPHSHFPVCKGSLDKLVGVVHIKDLIAYGLLAGSDFRVTAVAHLPLFVPESCPALRLLDQFKSTKTHIAFVVDEYGGTLGLLTLNDLVGALVGDIGRRGEEPPPGIVPRDDGTLLIDGRLPLHELLAALGLPPDTPTPDASTAAGILTALIGHIPRESEHATWLGWRLEVVDMDGKRVDQILAKRVSESVTEPQPDPRP